MTSRSICPTIAIVCALAGCGPRPVHVLGRAPASPPSSTARQILVGHSPSLVVLKGEMVEKCPIAGCWFMLHDQTGTVRVDTRSAGFVVTEVPLHTLVTVMGSPVHGEQGSIAATGLSY